MRLWSVHPSYLDTKGLLAVWREGLLALHVLQGKTRGYTHHPQLLRFQNQPEPIALITAYLHSIVDEATKRGFHFKREKLIARKSVTKLTVTIGQLEYETQHLLKKLKVRNPAMYKKYQNETRFEPHPLFSVVSGKIADWEKVAE